jgi:hypothetical protein
MQSANLEILNYPPACDSRITGIPPQKRLSASTDSFFLPKNSFYDRHQPLAKTAHCGELLTLNHQEDRAIEVSMRHPLEQGSPEYCV